MKIFYLFFYASRREFSVLSQVNLKSCTILKVYLICLKKCYIDKNFMNTFAMSSKSKLCNQELFILVGRVDVMFQQSVSELLDIGSILR
jgi:hypothetical protein